jgi:hypothetical protein
MIFAMRWYYGELARCFGKVAPGACQPGSAAVLDHLRLNASNIFSHVKKLHEYVAFLDRRYRS